MNNLGSSLWFHLSNYVGLFSLFLVNEQNIVPCLFCRYFIVLDDIWDVKTWNAIKDIFPMTSYGSKIITTTRINDVAQECCRSSTNGHIYNISPLSMEQSAQLFYRRLFNPEEKCPSQLEEISSKIWEKCAGLPLAIIAISGLLSSKEKHKGAVGSSEKFDWPSTWKKF